jgi:8-oxo-dGTP pyrophosphatase MutT (NUDIX family)
LKNSLKTTSSAVIVTDGVSIVLGHITNQNAWDVPKGKVDGGESFLQAAIRELKEETGLQAPPSDLIPLGVKAYKKHKNLAIYVWPQKQMPDPDTLVCMSMFDDKKGKQLPELDDFAVVSWEDIDNYTRNEMTTVLRSVENQVKEVVKQNARY